MRRDGGRRDDRAAALGLEELMIVNPDVAGGRTRVLLGDDGGVYRVRIAGTAGGWFVGDDGSLYEDVGARPAARRPRHFLGADGGLYAAEWTAPATAAPLGCACGCVRGARPCSR